MRLSGLEAFRRLGFQRDVSLINADYGGDDGGDYGDGSRFQGDFEVATCTGAGGLGWLVAGFIMLAVVAMP